MATGEPGDPYVISAPGAGAGTRTWDRASVYAGSDGHYPSPPPEYAKFDWFGPTDPTADGQSPRQYDGWYSTANDAPISVRYTDFVETDDAGTTLLTAVLPPDLHTGDVGVITYSGAGPDVPATPPDWLLVGAAVRPGTVTAVWVAPLDEGSIRNVMLTPINLPAGAFVVIYTGVDQTILDSVAVSGAADNATSLTIGSVATNGPGLLLSVAGISRSSDAALVTPSGMSPVMTTQGTAPRQQLASQTVGAGGTGGRTWQHTPNSVPVNYTGLNLVLHPGQTVTYYLWLDGAWVPVGGSNSQSTGGGGGSSGARDFVTTIGNATASTFTVVHPLASLDVAVEVINTDTGQTCWPVVRRLNQDSVYLDFGTTIPPADTRRVLISRRG